MDNLVEVPKINLCSYFFFFLIKKQTTKNRQCIHSSFLCVCVGSVTQCIIILFDQGRKWRKIVFRDRVCKKKNIFLTISLSEDKKRNFLRLWKRFYGSLSEFKRRKITNQWDGLEEAERERECLWRNGIHFLFPQPSSPNRWKHWQSQST